MRKRFERLTGLMVGTYRTTWPNLDGPAPWLTVGATWTTEGGEHHRTGICVVFGGRGFYVARGAS